jgi:hypothetical protein
MDKLGANFDRKIAVRYLLRVNTTADPWTCLNVRHSFATSAKTQAALKPAIPAPITSTSKEEITSLREML